MMKIKSILIVLIAIGLFSFVMKKDFKFTYPKTWPNPKYNFADNPLSEEKIFLGRVLFFDPILSADNSISCASCHSPYNAFSHADHALSHGINDQIGNRNALTLQNLAWNNFFMWDGAIHHLDAQALAPITHPKEMGEKFENVILKIKRSNTYPDLYKNAFGTNEITGEKTLKAISQFMLSLISSNSKYDRVKSGIEDFTDQEKKGYKIFTKNCSSCHTEPLFTNGNFEKNGIAVDPELKDVGRIMITKEKKDSLKFKVPTLRNIEFSFPYMHDGRYKKLSEVINHYNAQKEIKNTDGKAINLSSDEKVELIAFLLTLTDKEFLFNKKHGFPKEILSKSEGIQE